ncbi:MAG: hypothetical protein ACRDFS_06100 [Chloroflexota bacterium]
MCNLSSDSAFNTLTVGQVLAIDNAALGGGSTVDGITDLDDIAAQLGVSSQQGIYVSP